MIEPKNMYEDLRSDEIGQAINELRKIPKWVKEKHDLKRALIKKLLDKNYISWARTRAYFWMCGGIGFSYIYDVPLTKNGRFRPYRGKLLRLVYVDSAKNYLEIRFGIVNENQRGRNLSSLSTVPINEHFDPRSVFPLTRGE
jgi:hypothetical protein